ncbi:5'-methylthioadenosine/S-adenosylhomocysteine nucleosidase [Acrocarpospora sp. B8E8]|uniref:5'-methylthioadenosine/S-adenosylhomocysteine nucleosidase family protein n=1 Tax=Acrocarpospora sp. B8E8 TaxID=3153572 RepID=UPI00325C3603
MNGDVSTNSGIVISGGTANISGSAVGTGATVQTSGGPRAEPERQADIGVITILPVEMGAVRDVLDLNLAMNGGTPFYEGTVHVRGTSTRVAALRAHSQGQRSAVMAFTRLTQHYAPEIVVISGIAGGVNPHIAIGDVAVSTEVVYYDLRKETAFETRRRTSEQSSPATITHAVNCFFTDYGDPAHFQTADARGVSRGHRVLHGPIGSGEAVIADADSEIVHHLRAVNDKILAVDMEAGGLAQAFHEREQSSPVRGWAVVRGISDNADQRKNDGQQATAAWHAAVVLRSLIPYFRLNVG